MPVFCEFHTKMPSNHNLSNVTQLKKEALGIHLSISEEVLHLRKKWTDCHKTKTKSIGFKASNKAVDFDLDYDLGFEFSGPNIELGPKCCHSF